MIQVGIVGGTGYTGVELLRILALHPEVDVCAVTSRSDTGRAVADVYPSLLGVVNAVFCQPDVENLLACDLVFFATPNGTAMTMAPQLLAEGVKVVDLSADFRIQDVAVWERWYNMTHACPERIAEAVYGLPELNRDALRNARLVACPGCYPTAVQLGFWPLLAAGLIDPATLIADVKSGVSGAGRKAALATLMGETGESFKAYAASGHRHLPEIRQGLAAMCGSEVGLTFVPHLVPMIRGIHATLYARLSSKVEADDAQIRQCYAQHYTQAHFVQVLPTLAHPDTRSVKGSNQCQIAVHRPQGGRQLVILSVIDNLVKGAAGQAVQCMNLMSGLEESTGLKTVALYP